MVIIAVIMEWAEWAQNFFHFSGVYPKMSMFICCRKEVSGETDVEKKGQGTMSSRIEGRESGLTIDWRRSQWYSVRRGYWYRYIWGVGKLEGTYSLTTYLLSSYSVPGTLLGRYCREQISQKFWPTWSICSFYLSSVQSERHLLWTRLLNPEIFTRQKFEAHWD